MDSIFVIPGKGIVATETEERIVTEGNIVLISPGEKHRHGATPNSGFSHVYVSRLGSTLTQWDE